MASISRTLGDQLLEIIRLREALAAAQQQIELRNQAVAKLEKECDGLRMELKRQALDAVVESAGGG